MEKLLFAVPLTLAIIILSVPVTVLIVKRWRAARRREAFRAAALGAGMEFEEVAPALVTELHELKLMSRGYSQQLRNVMRGDRGDTKVTIADHRWVTGGGRDRQVHRASLAILRRGGLALPHVFFRPQLPVLDKVGKLFGGQDIDFPDDPEFSGAVVLQGEDEAAVRTLFGPSLRPQVLQAAHGLRVEGRGEVLLVQGRRIRPEDAAAFIESSTALLEVIAAALPRRW